MDISMYMASGDNCNLGDASLRLRRRGPEAENDVTAEKVQLFDAATEKRERLKIVDAERKKKQITENKLLGILSGLYVLMMVTVLVYVLYLSP